MMQYLRKNVRTIMLIVVILFVVSCFAGYGMYSGDRSTASGDGPKDYPVATIDGENVMRSTMDYEMVQFIQARGLAQTISDDDFPHIRSMILDQMAIMSELDKEVKARQITISKEELDSTMKDIESSFPTREIFLQEIQRVGMDEKALRIDVEEQMRRQAVFEQVVAPASTDQQELRSFYDTLKDYAFQKQEGFMVNIAHFSTEDGAAAAYDEVKGGAAWDDVMTSVSGDILNYIPFDSPVFVPTSEMRDEVEFLKDAPMNEVTAPVMLTSDDFMIVVKRTKQEAGTSDFDEVSADIEEMILNQKRQGLQSQFLQELRARASVNVLDEELFSKPEPPADEIDASKDDVSGDITKEIVIEETLPPSDETETSKGDTSGDVTKEIVIEETAPPSDETETRATDGPNGANNSETPDTPASGDL